MLNLFGSLLKDLGSHDGTPEAVRHSLSIPCQNCLGPGGSFTKSMEVLSRQVRDYFPQVDPGSHRRKAMISAALTEIAAVPWSLP